MDSKTYWRLREEEALKHYITDEKEYSKQIQQIYSDMLASINEQVNGFYGRYAAKEGITLAEAKKRVSKLDIAEYERKAKKYVKEKDFSKQANEEMLLYNATMKINRLEMLKANIGLEMIAGHNELEKFMAGILKGRTEEELKRQAGILGKTVLNNAKKADAIVNGSFKAAKVGSRSAFSDRIWQYQDVMREDLAKLLQTGLIQGKNARVLTSDLRKYLLGDKVGKGATYNVERLMRTELARVQTEAQKESFKRNGFSEYMFIANASCCEDCQALHGKHFKVEKMMPGDNAPPVHPHCRCSVAAYEDNKEYEAWLDYLDNGGTTKEWNAAGRAAWEKENSQEYLRNNLPRAYKDTRKVGKPISTQDLENVMNYAESKGVQIGHQSNKTGGFEKYCGDVDILKDIIDEIEKQQNSPLYKKAKAKKLILCYDNVLGYNDDLSKIDVGAFAITKGRTITLNKFMFDDSSFLKAEYLEAAERNLFVKGTSYINIVDHESGHIIEKELPKLRKKVIAILEKEASKQNISVDQYIIENVSLYAADLNDSGELHELISELNSLLTIGNNSNIIKLLRKEGAL